MNCIKRKYFSLIEIISKHHINEISNTNTIQIFHFTHNTFTHSNGYIQIQYNSRDDRISTIENRLIAIEKILKQ